MKILLTGSTGYVGSSIASALAERGATVLTAGRHAENPIALDLTDPQSVRSLQIPRDIHTLIHAAAAHEVFCSESPTLAYTVNVTSTRALIDRALECGVKRLIYISTFHVFGHPEGIIDEGVIPRPANDYGLTHHFAEQIFQLASRKNQAHVNIIRPANIFGTPTGWLSFDRWTLAPFDFIQQGMKTGKIILRSDGSPVRHYVSLSRLNDSVISASLGNLPEITHVSGCAWSMRDLANLAAKAVGKKRPCSIILGPSGAPEKPYRFLSNHWKEENIQNQEMAEFMGSISCHLEETLTNE